MLNFRTGDAVRKFFNSENFPIYGTYLNPLLFCNLGEQLHVHLATICSSF